MWKIEFLHDSRGWIEWKHGSLEEVLPELFDFLGGAYGAPYSQARIVSPEREY